MSAALRVELFGDVVERIRAFDPATQRAAAEALTGPVRIFPARVVLINGRTVARVRERLTARADDIGIHRTVRDPVLESVRPARPDDRAAAARSASRSASSAGSSG